MIRFVVISLAVFACDPKADEARQERRYVDKELAELEQAFATGSESGITVGCAGLSVSVERMPAPVADKIKQRCHVDSPRFFLERAIAKVKKENAAHPDMTDINCMQLFVEDALATLAKYPPAEPALQKLVDEWAQLCPPKKK